MDARGVDVAAGDPPVASTTADGAARQSAVSGKRAAPPVAQPALARTPPALYTSGFARRVINPAGRAALDHNPAGRAAPMGAARSDGRARRRVADPLADSPGKRLRTPSPHARFSCRAGRPCADLRRCRSHRRTGSLVSAARSGRGTARRFHAGRVFSRTAGGVARGAPGAGSLQDRMVSDASPLRKCSPHVGRLGIGKTSSRRKQRRWFDGVYGQAARQSRRERPGAAGGQRPDPARRRTLHRCPLHRGSRARGGGLHRATLQPPEPRYHLGCGKRRGNGLDVLAEHAPIAGRSGQPRAEDRALCRGRCGGGDRLDRRAFGRSG